MAQIHNMFPSLGFHYGDSFTVSDNCLAKLEEVLKQLGSEDPDLRTYRRAIGFGQNIRKDLLPLLHLKDDTKNATKIIDTTIKILVNLTIPVEYLLPIETISQTDVGRHTIFELNNLLTASKASFTEGRSTKALMDHIKFVLESDLETDVDSINNCLLLLRNILHIPEGRIGTNTQNQIIWNLFTQSIDKVIIYLISCPQKMYFGVTMVQLIALLYKDQHVGTLQKLLNLWLEASLSDSSDDNESNTSPPDQGSDDSLPIITSDPTSDSSDNSNSNVAPNKTIVQNRGKTLTSTRVKSTETEISTSSSGVSSMYRSDYSEEKSQGSKQGVSSQSEDFGYGTQVENQESISTSSNEEEQPRQKPVHQKPHTFQKSRYSSGKGRTVLDKKELRRKKLVKRSRTTTITMKGLMHHAPTDEDVANILKEFTVDFLLKGYGTLTHDLYTQFLSNIHHIQIDTSHFFWLVTYFLKFATQLELDLEHVGQVLSPDIFSFLIFQATWIYEELENMRKFHDIDLKPCLRRLHLVVTAIREFLQAVDRYQKMIHLSDDDRRSLRSLQELIIKTSDLKSLFLLFLRQFSPEMQSKQYLQDLILTNHNYLLLLDTTRKQHNFDITEHLKKFATVEIMRQYGLLLENFQLNGEFVNNCVFTMMHHIGGDLDHVQSLFQPGILKTFSQIWDTDYEICDDWSDLIEYIMHKFVNSSRPNADLGNKLEGSQQLIEWSKEDKDNLLGYYNQSRNSQDTIATIRRKYEEIGVNQKSQFSIIHQLLEQNIINQTQYNNFIRVETPEHVTTAPTTTQDLPDIDEPLVDDDIKVLREYLCKDNKAKFVTWLQHFLLETCYVKLVLANPDQFRNHTALREPIIYYSALLNLPIPLIPWTGEQNNILDHQPFVLLLHKLGIYSPIDTGKIFFTIPNFWDAEHLFGIAQQLGPIKSAKLQFDVAALKVKKRPEGGKHESMDVTNAPERRFSLGETKLAPLMVRSTPPPNSGEWFGTNNHISKIHLDYEPQLSSISQLSIAIPGSENLPPSELGTVQALSEFSHDHMDCSPMQDDNEHNSVWETASIASDLTQMCVSDEEDKIVLVIEQ